MIPTKSDPGHEARPTRIGPAQFNTPLMGFEEAAAFIPGMTVGGLRKEIERGSALGRELLPFLVRFSQRRRYFKRQSFLAWLQSKSS
jgi:hypothetical protein